jgi:hypothetical protein
MQVSYRCDLIQHQPLITYSAVGFFCPQRVNCSRMLHSSALHSTSCHLHCSAPLLLPFVATLTAQQLHAQPQPIKQLHLLPRVT